MKRSPFLEHLSHEHHEGLVIATRLKNGLERQVDYGSLKNYLQQVWEHHLAPHFLDEEVLLIPVLEQAGKGAMAERLLLEHTRIRSLVAEALGGAVTEPYQRFVGILKEHIRFEERELFPTVEIVADEATLASIGRRLAESPPSEDLQLPPWEN